jgi:hypothetical protein
MIETTTGQGIAASCRNCSISKIRRLAQEDFDEMTAKGAFFRYGKPVKFFARK